MRVPGLVLVFLLASSGAPAAWAQAEPRLHLAEAIAEALKAHPDVLAAQQRHEAARQRPAQERSLPDPMVAAGYVASGKPLPGAGIGREPGAGIGLMLTQDIPFPGKRDARAAVAAREADAELERIEAARLDVVRRVRQSYFALAYTYEVAGVLVRNHDLLATLLRVSEERYAVGQAAQQDVIKAQTQLSVLELQQQRILQLRRAHEADLRALLSRPSDHPIGRPDTLTFAPFNAALDTLIEQASRAPMLRREQVMVDRAELAVNLARLDYKPDFSLSGGYTYTGSMPSMYEVRFGVTIPLQRKRRAAAVAEHLAGASAARHDYDSTRLAVQASVQTDFEMASTAARLATIYRDTVLPQARLALESSMASYQTGRVDFLSVLTNFLMVLEYEMTWFEQLNDLHQAVSRLEGMTGISILH